MNEIITSPPAIESKRVSLRRYVDVAHQTVDQQIKAIGGLNRSIANRIRVGKKGFMTGALVAGLAFNAGCVYTGEDAEAILRAQEQRNAIAATTTPPTSDGRPTLSATISAAVNNSEPTSTSIPTPTEIPKLIEPPTLVATPTSTLEPTSTPEELKNQFLMGITIYYDKNNIPVKYTDFNQQEHLIDKGRFEKIKQQAINDAEPEIFEVIPIPLVRDGESANNRPEHPIYKELPDDVLSPEELEKEGVDIIQSNNTELYIRKGSFKKGGPLDLKNSHGRKLTIVLVDGPQISNAYLSDPKYDQLRDFTKAFKYDVDGFRRQEIERYNKYLENFRVQLKTLDPHKYPNNRKVKELQENILSVKTEINNLESFADTQHLLAQMLANGRDAAGVYVPPSYSDNNKAVVFVAVGEDKDQAFMRFIIDATGEFQVHSTLAMGSGHLVPNASQSFPDPSGYILNPDASRDKPFSYPYAGETPGLILRHELKHDELMTRTSGKSNTNEYDTDMGAVNDIRIAWQRWVNSGYKDDSGYSFVFRLPGGGYILTKDTNSIPNQTESF